MKEPDEVFSIKLKNGQEVEVSWYKDYFSTSDHIEFRGPMTETGYYSHFVQKERGEQVDRGKMLDHLQEVAQACWESNKAKHGTMKAMF